jgi:phosphoribosylformimino-5-aminoimidazole carboxamide ribotide isomerase
VLIIPAIDLSGGQAVRLRGGRREEMTVYHERPWELGRVFADAGAERIHVVDLDGAFGGTAATASRAALERLLRESPVPIELGGGLRDVEAVDAALATGARWVVLGTAAVKQPALVERLCRQHRDRIIVAVDAVNGMVAVEGWTETSGVEANELGRRASLWGAAALLYTDVTRDGLEVGPNVAATAALARACSAPVIASGGVGTLDHLRDLASEGVSMCVVGRALYERRFTLEEAIAAGAERGAGQHGPSGKRR